MFYINFTDLVKELELNEGEVQDEHAQIQIHHEKVFAEYESHEEVNKDVSATVTGLISLI